MFQIVIKILKKEIENKILMAIKLKLKKIKLIIQIIRVILVMLIKIIKLREKIKSRRK